VMYQPTKHGANQRFAGHAHHDQRRNAEQHVAHHRNDGGRPRSNQYRKQGRRGRWQRRQQYQRQQGTYQHQRQRQHERDSPGGLAVGRQQRSDQPDQAAQDVILRPCHHEFDHGRDQQRDLEYWTGHPGNDIAQKIPKYDHKQDRHQESLHPQQHFAVGIQAAQRRGQLRQDQVGPVKGRGQQHVPGLAFALARNDSARANSDGQRPQVGQQQYGDQRQADAHRRNQ